MFFYRFFITGFQVIIYYERLVFAQHTITHDLQKNYIIILFKCLFIANNEFPYLILQFR